MCVCVSMQEASQPLHSFRRRGSEVRRSNSAFATWNLGAVESVASYPITPRKQDSYLDYKNSAYRTDRKRHHFSSSKFILFLYSWPESALTSSHRFSDFRSDPPFQDGRSSVGCNCAEARDVSQPDHSRVVYIRIRSWKCWLGSALDGKRPRVHVSIAPLPREDP